MKIDYSPLFWGVTIGFSLLRLFDYLAWRIVLASGSQEITASEFTSITLNINNFVVIVIQICAGIHHIAIKSMQVKKEIDALLKRLGKQ